MTSLEQAQQGERAREAGGRRGGISLSPAKAGSDLIGDGYPGLRSLTPG